MCHSYESFNTCYLNTGLWGVYFVCDPMKCDDMTSTVMHEWMRVCTCATQAEVERAKNELITNLLRQREGNFGIKYQIFQSNRL